MFTIEQGIAMNLTKYITLQEWDALYYSKPHSIRTLRSWAASGLIQPQPQKHGREYMVQENAVYCSAMKAANDDPVLEQILNG